MLQMLQSTFVQFIQVLHVENEKVFFLNFLLKHLILNCTDDFGFSIDRYLSTLYDFYSKNVFDNVWYLQTKFL